MSQKVIAPEVESPVEASPAENQDEAPNEESQKEETATQEETPQEPLQGEGDENAVKRTAEELSQASQEETCIKKPRVLEGGDNQLTQEVTEAN